MEEKESNEPSQLYPCEHLDEATVYTANSIGCEECVENGYKWVHLSLCLPCGHVCSCDTSRYKHATKHFHATGHPIVASYDPSEEWHGAMLMIVSFPCRGRLPCIESVTPSEPRVPLLITLSTRSQTSAWSGAALVSRRQISGRHFGEGIGLEMTGTGYSRVSKRRLCRICGKPDWCSRTAAETISFCARITLNSNRVSRHGWGVYYHQEFNSGLPFKRRLDRPPKSREVQSSIAIASPEIRDKIYRKLIELSPASSNSKLVNGRGGLSDRRIDDISQYGSFPRTVNERRVLVDQLIQTQAECESISFEGVPGFWKDAAEEWRLGSISDSNDEMLLIPFTGRDGLIQACQIRFMRHVEGRSGNYVWLSSAKERLGSSSGSLLHHMRPCSSIDLPVLVTEGALKAATAQRFLTDRYVVGNSGVATAHREIVEAARGRKLEIAFDNDSFTNPHVARALAALLRLRYLDQAAFGFDEEVRIITWERSVKGIDDALVSGLHLEYLTAAEWLKCLTPECFETANHQVALIGSDQTGGRQAAVWVSRTTSRTFPSI